MKKTFLLCAMVLAIPCLAQPSLEAPEPPYLKPITSGSSWSVEVTKQAAPSTEETAATEASRSPEAEMIRSTFHPTLLRIEYFKDANQVVEVRRTWDAGTTRSFFVGTHYLEESLPAFPGRYRVVAESTYGVPMPDWTTSDFPDLNWLSPEAFQKFTSVRGRRTAHFKEVATVNSGDPQPIPREAWIDLDRGLPVEWSDGSYNYKLSGVQRWDGEVNLPEAASAMLPR